VTEKGFTFDETGVDRGANASDSPLPIDPGDLRQVANMARDCIASLPAAQSPNMTTLRVAPSPTPTNASSS
jgi:hypothetical protein